MAKEFYDIADLTAAAYEKDTRALAAFAAVITPPGDMPFGLDVVMALKSLDWRKLLSIAFSEPMNLQQSVEFLDTLENLCDALQQNEIVSFIGARFPNSIDLIHPDMKDRFASISAIARTKQMDR